MDTRRAILTAMADGPVSGPTVAEQLAVSRAAVWKAVEGLRAEGFEIVSTAEGYVAPANPAYGAAGIEFELNAPYTVEYYDAIGSTNDCARDRADEGARNVVVVADEQTGSRGRLDRTWNAPSGGVWASILTRPAVPPAHVPVVTLAAAVAVTDACRAVGIDAKIKWPNDVLVPSKTSEADSEKDAFRSVNGTGPSFSDSSHTQSGESRSGRKLSGILTEMEGEADRVSWVIVGIGVNVNIETGELPAGATSIQEERGTAIDRRPFIQHLLERYHDLTTDPSMILPAWRERSDTLGRLVRIETPTKTIEGTAIDVEFPGQLIIDTGDERVRVHAGDCEHLRPAIDTD